jgi:hypothetical protein
VVLFLREDARLLSSVIVVHRENHRVERRAGTVVVTIWKRPDLSREEGANLAVLLKGTVMEEAARSNATRLVLDLTDAHPAWGPKTHEALVTMVGAWRGKSIVVVAPEAITRMGLQQVCKSARVTARFVSSVREVERQE